LSGLNATIDWKKRENAINISRVQAGRSGLFAERFNIIGWIWQDPKQELIMFNRLASRLAALT